VTPADSGIAYVDATFTTSDGVRLSGWYIPSMNGAAMVVLHGASSTRSAVLDQAAVLARHGYGVLLYDARGMGRSDGRAMNFGWYGDRDLAAAIDFVASQPDVDPTASPRSANPWVARKRLEPCPPTIACGPWSPKAPPIVSPEIGAGSPISTACAAACSKASSGSPIS
jgi:fermentation-respiration switch protein FrsA (DUF1100 family)